MLVIPLGSGSAGNCHFVESEGTRVLVDCGFGIRETKRRLEAIDRRIEEIDAILISHEHTDHIRGAEAIARKFGIPVHLSRGTLEASRIEPETIPVRTFASRATFRVGEMQIHVCGTSHDAAESVCFVLEARDGARLGVASDMGCVLPEVREHLSGCDALLFEANHDLDMLRNGSYPWSLKRRIMSRFGHLSNDDSMAALRVLIGEELRTLCLIHLSKQNNHESIVRGMATDLIQAMGASVDLRVSMQDEPGEPIEIDRRPLPETRAPQRQLALF